MVLSVIICFNINPVSADPPIVDSIVPWTSGADTILNITVIHPYAELHWCDLVDVEIDGVIHSVDTSNHETSPFVVQYNMGEVTDTPTVRARGICSNTGPGPWCEPIVIPEFSSSLLLLFFIVVSIGVLLLESKIYKQNDEIIKK